MKTLISLFIAAGASLAAATSIPAAKVSGRVLYDGERPEPKPLVIDPKRAEGCVHEGEQIDDRDQSLLIDKDGGLANVVVTVEVPGAKVEAPSKAIQVDQRKCRFEPHVMVVPVGATVEFLNSDKAAHNVHALPFKGEGFNENIASGGKYVAKFDRADKINVKCDLHPWMNSWLIVSDTPFFAVTGADGRFAIEGLPPGQHKATYWHERLGKFAGTIQVGADGTAAPIELKMAPKPKK